ncbi:polysaccharide biosynthesis/export family protein [Cognatishimia sp. D5M38]|uniref:Polysaccharide biosynthesis/export family protein n=1 Tax=Cognatishimia coralii TaxID=3083254 RepID=A0ABU8QKY3_9RHOB
MRIAVSIFCLMSFLAGCTEVLRQPNFNLDEVENPEAEVIYQVTGYDITPAVVSRANKSPFIRYVNIGGNGVGPVRNVPESALFSGAKPPSNKRPDYVIGVGDTVVVNRSGYSVNADGIRTRQAANNSYLVNEEGAVDLLEGRSVVIEGLTISEAKMAIRSALRTTISSEAATFSPIEFPVAKPPEYRLGNGDIIRVSRLIETTDKDGVLTQSVQTSKSVIGSNGVVSVLQLGEVEAAGLTLSEVRDRVLQEAIRNAGGIDTVVEIQSFVSQTALVTGDLGTRVIQLTDQPLTYDRLIAQFNPSFVGDRDYRVTLERAGQTYQMSAKSIVMGGHSGPYYVFDDDRIILTEMLPTSDVQLNVTNFGARSLTYLRVTDNDAALAQQGKAVPFDLRGIDLRGLLIAQGIDVTQNEDLLIRLNRANKTYNLSAQSTVLNNPGKRYWLAPDDHVVVEDIAYVGTNALLVGEIGLPRQLPINQHSRTTLSQALFDGGAFSAAEADFRHVYVLRGEGLKYDAYHFDITQVLNLGLAEDFELRPGDIMFVRTRPISRYTRALTAALTFVNAIDVGITNSRTFGR